MRDTILKQIDRGLPTRPFGQVLFARESAKGSSFRPELIVRDQEPARKKNACMLGRLVTLSSVKQSLARDTVYLFSCQLIMLDKTFSSF
jgi:hypothetical protein